MSLLRLVCVFPFSSTVFAHSNRSIIHPHIAFNFMNAFIHIYEKKWAHQELKARETHISNGMRNGWIRNGWSNTKLSPADDFDVSNLMQEIYQMMTQICFHDRMENIAILLRMWGATRIDKWSYKWSKTNQDRKECHQKRCGFQKPNYLAHFSFIMFIKNIYMGLFKNEWHEEKDFIAI